MNKILKKFIFKSYNTEKIKYKNLLFKLKINKNKNLLNNFILKKKFNKFKLKFKKNYLNKNIKKIFKRNIKIKSKNLSIKKILQHELKHNFIKNF